jgi:hypothetical protein
MFRDVWCFIQAIWKHWKLLIAGVTLTFFQFWLPIWGASLSPMIAKCILGATLLGACFLAWLDERNAKNAVQAKLGPRLSVLHFDYNEGKQELETELMFHNEGSVQSTIISVSFIYRSDKSHPGYELFSTGPKDAPFIGHIDPIKLAAQSDEIRQYKAHVEPGKFDEVGAEAGLYIHFSVSGRNKDAAILIAMEVVASNLTKPAKNFPAIDRILLDDISESKHLAALIRGRVASPTRVLPWYLKICNRLFDY